MRFEPAKGVAARRSSGAGTPVVVEGALLLVSLAAGIGLGRLGTNPGAWRVVSPIALSVLAGHVATAVVRRRGRRRFGASAELAAGAAAGLAAVALVETWWFLPSQTWWGVPTPRTWHAAEQALRGAWALIRAEPTPVNAVPGIVLSMALGAGVAAVCARSLLVLGPTRRGLALGRALAPTALLFGYTSLLDSGADRPQAALAYVVAVALLMLTMDGSLRQAPSGARRHVLRPFVLGALALAVAVPALLVPSLSAMRPRAFVTSADGGIGGIGASGALVSLSAGIDSISLVDDVGAVLRQRPKELLFVARSPVATYWQVATLTAFDGQRWTADPETVAALEGTTLPEVSLPLLAQPSAAALYDASVTMADLQTSLLPVPPATVSVGDTQGDAELIAGVGARLARGTAYGTVYHVRAVAAPGRPATRAPGRDQLAPYLELPPLPASVTSLARRLVSGTHDPVAAARELVDFFAQGGFRYSLSPRIPGADPLTGFLFVTREGFCQQFAGAYAVLARAAGLPTRLAVGFTTGSPSGAGVYRVTGADAHVWPEVYAGRQLGWLSVDPTPPPPGAAVVTAPGVLLASAVGSGVGGPFVAAFAPHGPTGGGASAPAVPSPAGGQAPSNRAHRSSAGRTLDWVVVGAGVAIAVVALWRRRLVRLVRRVRWRALPPERAVVAIWQDAAITIGRRPDETPHEHAARVATSFDGAGVAYGELARLAAWAGYSGDDVTRRHSARARSLHAAAAAATRR
jgi:transglutaminase-like putative cysteine protease